ncbi:MAG: hypothetical protein WBR10_02405 [Candidatus Acidiferrum sp.]
MKRSAIVIGVLFAAVLAAAPYFWVGSAVPPGQEPLATLTQNDLAEFANAFDKSADGPRLVLLLSPT